MRVCPQCGAEIVRKETENDYKFSLRTFCNQKCFRSYMRRKKRSE